jgi:N-alpha-acetyltransferase 10/11
MACGVANVYYVADTLAVAGRSLAIPDGVKVLPVAQADIPVLSHLYRRAYARWDLSFEDAVAEMESAFDGTWGELWPEASLAAWIGDDPAAVVLAVRCPPMDDAPGYPWLIEVFTDPHRRRTGLARIVITVSGRVMVAAGEERVGLTVDDNNLAAVALYQSLGFGEEM